MGGSLCRGRAARAAGVSDAYLCRLFKDFTGQTVAHYTAHCRVARAKDGLMKPGSTN
jgi:AraC-like DNA-binding protein